MAHRPGLRVSELKATLRALLEAGIRPASLEMRPDGTYRWYLAPEGDVTEAVLDRELAAFDRKHGYVTEAELDRELEEFRNKHGY